MAEMIPRDRIDVHDARCLVIGALVVSTREAQALFTICLSWSQAFLFHLEIRVENRSHFEIGNSVDEKGEMEWNLRTSIMNDERG
jgi:hypothetical protein